MSEPPTDPTQNPSGEDTTGAPDGNPPGPFTDPDDLPPGDPALEDPQHRPGHDGLPAEPSEDDAGAPTPRGGEDASAADTDRG